MAWHGTALRQSPVPPATRRQEGEVLSQRVAPSAVHFLHAQREVVEQVLLHVARLQKALRAEHDDVLGLASLWGLSGRLCDRSKITGRRHRDYYQGPRPQTAPLTNELTTLLPLLDTASSPSVSITAGTARLLLR
jgi:hypothetical protein